ncbi:proton pump interactor, putative [Medicago truncatula]|uniref:Proton pump interactor, putative n=1 Tax=Medicago truncatula TaxID=3880 RepID=A0A072VCH2_MEDTR|nr:proton pump interactor, putative [Medicago truncatula]
MENKETTSPTKHDERRMAINGDSEHVSRIAQQFYFVKLCPTDPNSISKIKKEENLIKKMNQDICEITESITKKMSKGEYLNSLSKYYPQSDLRNHLASNENIVGDLYMTLDQLNFINKVANGEWFGEKLDKNSLNYFKLHRSKSLAEEKQILRDIKILQKDVASFKSPSHLINSCCLPFYIMKLTYKQGGIEFCWNNENLDHIRKNYSLNDWGNLVIEIEIFKIQHLERVSGNDSVKANISSYESLKKRIEDKIKILCDESLKARREWMECRTKGRHDMKELEAINRELYSLREKLTEKHKKKDEAYQRILKLKKLHHEEVMFLKP